MLKLMVDIGDIESINMFHKLIFQEYLLFMHEYPHINKELVFKIKSIFSNKNIPHIDLLQTLVAESISKEKAFKPFWNYYLTSVSKNLLLPTMTDLQGLEWTYLNGFSKNTNQKSWSLTIPNIYPMNRSSQKISFLSQLFSPQDIMEEEDQRYARKIRIYPTSEQKIMLKQQFGLSRYYYNQTIYNLNKDSKNRYNIMNKLSKQGCIYQKKVGSETCKGKLMSKYFCEKHNDKYFKYKHYKSNIDMRTHILKNDVEDWKKNIPFDSKTLMINNAIESYKSAISNLKNGNIQSFKMGFRTKKDKSQILKIDHRELILFEKINKTTKKKEPNIFLFKNSLWKKFPQIKIKNKKDFKWLQKQFEVGPQYKRRQGKKVLKKCFIPSDFILKFEYPNKYYLCIPSYRNSVNNKAPFEVVSLDPGIRTFQTFYSPEGVIGKLGDNVDEKLIKIGKRIDKLESYSKSVNNSKKKMRINKRCSILRTKIKNIVNDLHWKSASYLCKNYDKIIISDFKIKNMIKVGRRNINNDSVRKLLALSHSKFKERLKSTASHLGRKVYICSESYTSKTCGICGLINDQLGGKKIFDCDRCRIKIDRDINGARNIFLRQLSYLF